LCQVSKLHSNKKAATWQEADRNEVFEEWSDDDRGSDGSTKRAPSPLLQVGLRVKVRLSKRCRHDREGVVVACPELPLGVVAVSYEGWARHFDEFQLPANLRIAEYGGSGAPLVQASDTQVGDAVLVSWGALKEQFRAKVVGLYSGLLVRVHFDNSTGDWDQWVKPCQILSS